MSGSKCGPDYDNDGWPDRQLNCPEPTCTRDNCRFQFVKIVNTSK